MSALLTEAGATTTASSAPTRESGATITDGVSAAPVSVHEQAATELEQTAAVAGTIATIALPGPLGIAIATLIGGAAVWGAGKLRRRARSNG